MARQTFTNTPDPLPPCVGCKNGCPVVDENELFILVGVEWLCKKCFGNGAGRSWPRSQASTERLRARARKIQA